MEHQRCFRLSACLVLALLLAPSPWHTRSPLSTWASPVSWTAPAAGPGFYFAEYLMYWTANKLPGIDSPQDRFRAWGSLNQLIYQSNTPVLFGGKWALMSSYPWPVSRRPHQ